MAVTDVKEGVMKQFMKVLSLMVSSRQQSTENDSDKSDEMVQEDETTVKAMRCMVATNPTLIKKKFKEL